MHQSINNFSQFRDAFVQMDRGEQFTYSGLMSIYDYLEEYEQATGAKIELDVIGICCEYVEDTIDDIIKNYSLDVEDMSEWERGEFVEEWLQQHTTVVGLVDDSIVYVQF